jgi:hypothetical protein
VQNFGHFFTIWVLNEPKKIERTERLGDDQFDLNSIWVFQSFLKKRVRNFGHFSLFGVLNEPKSDLTHRVFWRRA